MQPTMLVTLQEASDHIRRDTTDDNNDLTLKIIAASTIVINYLKNWTRAYEGETDSSGDLIIDTSGDIIPLIDSNGDYIVNPSVKAATLIMVGILYRDRDGQEASQWRHGYLPDVVMSLLYPLRAPAME